MIPSAGLGLILIMLVVIPFVWGLPFGLVASELGSVRPQEGGYYKWVQEALGEFWGFQTGWWRTISIYIDNASYVILAGGYAATAWGFSKPVEFAIKMAMILIFTYINLRGVKDVECFSTSEKRAHLIHGPVEKQLVWTKSTSVAGRAPAL